MASPWVSLDSRSLHHTLSQGTLWLAYCALGAVLSAFPQMSH